MTYVSVGELRRSQLLWAYGPGALVDLPSISVLTLGTEQWPAKSCDEIEESRLLAKVRLSLGAEIQRLRLPPKAQEGGIPLGVPVTPFPRWLRCVRCGLLAHYSDSGFELTKNRQREACFKHTNCAKSKKADVVPARFLLACRAGHLDDFPWRWFVHGPGDDCQGELAFFEHGASLQTENLFVKCQKCNKSKSMAQAYGQAGRNNLPACRGRHPHIDVCDSSCDEEPRTIILGATNSWFPVTASVIALPESDSSLNDLIHKCMRYFENIHSVEQLAVVLETFQKDGRYAGFEKFTHNMILDELNSIRNGKTVRVGAKNYVSDLKEPEWLLFSADACERNEKNLVIATSEVPSLFTSVIANVLLIEKLREVNALYGFTRVEPPDENIEIEAASTTPIAPLGSSQMALDWVPAIEVFGEGIFIRFKDTALREWEKSNGVKSAEERLIVGYQGWCRKRGKGFKKIYPGIRYVMLHTLAHLLIREVALDCGYSEASIRERVYANTRDGRDQAGILIYTTAVDSDGTLGGLVEQGRPHRLESILRQALLRAQICASDPLCCEHNPSKDHTLHGAACHSCSFVSETSCECGNRHLDRTLIVPTISDYGGISAFFNPRLIDG